MTTNEGREGTKGMRMVIFEVFFFRPKNKKNNNIALKRSGY
jgi:hypothetical protein